MKKETIWTFVEIKTKKIRKNKILYELPINKINKKIKDLKKDKWKNICVVYDNQQNKIRIIGKTIIK